MEPLELEFTVACDAARAFALWAEQTTRWWPHGHSVSAAPGLTVTFEPRPGGRIYETTVDDLAVALADLKPGDRVPVELNTQTEARTVQVTLGQIPPA